MVEKKKKKNLKRSNSSYLFSISYLLSCVIRLRSGQSCLVSKSNPLSAVDPLTGGWPAGWLAAWSSQCILTHTLFFSFFVAGECRWGPTESSRSFVWGGAAVSGASVCPSIHPPLRHLADMPFGEPLSHPRTY